MLEYKESKNCLHVYGWDPEKGNDDIRIGKIQKCEEGYYWFMPDDDMRLSCKMLSELMYKVSAMNKGDK